MLVQSVPMEQTHDTQFHAYQNQHQKAFHTGTNVSAYFRQGDPMLSSVMTSARKCECLTFHLSVLVRSDAILVVTAHQSAYMAEILTHSITNSISCQNLTTKTKTLPNSLANL